VLVGIVAGAAQDAGVLTNERLREAASNRRIVFVMLLILILIGAVAGLVFAENVITYLEIVIIGFVYAAAVVRTVFVIRGSESS
jgi:Ca2+/Na+ antiporter